jgi:multidrug efflux pump subunit AcrB
MKRIRFGALLALSLSLAGCAGCWPQIFSQSTSAEGDPVLTVEALYPGASAAEVRDSLAALLEPQVTGIERLTQMRSAAAADGTYLLELSFQRGVDLNQARLLLQNRVALAVPAMPSSVSASGLTVRTKRPGLIAILTLSSLDRSQDAQHLRDFVDHTLRPELTRIPSIDHVAPFGGLGLRCRIWPDSQKMNSLGVRLLDVARAVDGQNDSDAPRKLAGSKPETEITLPLLAHVTGGSASVEEIANRTIKVTADNRVIHVRNVARVQWRDGPWSDATLNGTPVIAIGVHPTREARPREVSLALRERLSELKSKLPPRSRLELDFDFAPNIEAPEDSTTPHYLLLDLHTPDSSSTEGILRILNRCETILKGLDGVQATLALTQPIFDHGSFPASVLIRLSASWSERSNREVLIAMIRARLTGTLPDTLIRLRDLAGNSRLPSCTYPLDVAVVDTENRGYDELQALAERLALKLGQSGEITDAMASRGSIPLEALELELDLNKAMPLGVAESEVIRILQDYFSHVDSELNLGPGFSRLTAGPIAAHREAERLSQLKVRGSDGGMVPFMSVARVRQIQYARSFERMDGLPMVRITAESLPGVSPKAARARCERVIKDFNLPAGYEVR